MISSKQFYFKWLFLLSFWTVLVLAGLFPHKLLLACANWRFRLFCHNHYGASFECDSIRWKQGVLHLKGATIQKKGSFKILLEEAIFSPKLSLKTKEIGGCLEVENALFVYEKKALPNDFKVVKSPACLKPRLDMHIKNGVLELHSPEEGRVETMSCELQQQIIDSEITGILRLFLKPDTPPCEVQFTQKKDGQLRVDASFCALPAGILCWMSQYFFENHLPASFLQWQCLEGNAEGMIQFSVQEGCLTQVDTRMVLTKLVGNNEVLELLAGVDHCELALEFDLTRPNYLQDWKGEIRIEGGHAALAPFSQFPFKNSRMWNLSDLQSTIVVKNGQIESSSLNGYLMGMEGKMILDWRAHSEMLVTMKFQGDSREILPFLPNNLQHGFKSAFPDDLFCVDAVVMRLTKGLELKGLLTILENSENKSHTLNFGCTLGSSHEPELFFSQNLFEETSKSKTNAENETMSRLESLIASETLSPNTHMDLKEAFLNCLKGQFCLSTKKTGWIHGKQFPLEKFLSPFLLSGTHLQLTGVADFEAMFDERFLYCFYTLSHSKIEGEQFSLSFEGSRGLHELGVYCLDFEQQHHLGYFPLKEAVYEQKNANLLFKGCRGNVEFDDSKIKIQNIETAWNHLLFRGNIEIDIESIEDVDLKIRMTEIQGPVEDARAILSRFGASAFWEIPFQGDISSTLFLHYLFQPKGKLVEGTLLGHFDLAWHQNGFSLSPYVSEFAYEFLENRLCLKQGSCELHLPKQKKSIPFTIPSVVFDRFPKWEGCLSLESARGASKQLVLDANTTCSEQERKFQISGKHGMEEICIAGIQTGSEIRVEEISWGEWTGNALFDWKSCTGLLEIVNLKMGMLLLSGEYDPAAHSLFGEIQDLHADMESFFGGWLAPWHPKGSLDGEGTFEWNFKKNDMEARAVISFNSLEFGGVPFGNGENLHCLFSTESGLLVEGLEVSIPVSDSIERYKLGRFCYDLHQQKVAFNGCDFSLPPEKIPWAVELAQALFPGKIHPTFLDYVEALKQNEPLEGSFSVELFPESVWIHLSLVDGDYFFSGKRYSLRNFSLFYDPLKLNLRTQLQFRDRHFWLDFQSDSKTLSQGIIRISEEEQDLCTARALKAHWNRHRDTDWSIQSAAGQFFGLELNLVEKEKDVLQGTVAVLAPKIFEWLPVNKSFQMEPFSGKFIFEGEIALDKGNLPASSAKGKIAAQEISLATVELSSLSSEVLYHQDCVELKSFSIKDWAGHLFINAASLNKIEDAWHFYLDHLEIEGLRFSRIRNAWTERNRKEHPFFKALYVPKFVLENVAGNLADLNAFQGTGSLAFANFPKKTIFSNLLLLPTEFIARLGLDLSTLIPASGDILYEISEGKIYLKKFKKMYSDGKRSRFYLVEGYPAFIDFKGNLDIKVKMKQYNLLMKLAELFTVTIKGTCLKPSYSLSTDEVEQHT